MSPMMYKRCSWIGCTEKVPFGVSRCEKHRKQSAKEYGATRPTFTQRGYDAQWTRVRDAYIRAHPLCEDCLKEGRTEVATLVHHKIDVAKGGEHTEDNLVSLCMIHHAKKRKKNV